MKRQFILISFLFSTISVSAYFVGPQETNAQATIRIMKAATIGAGIGAINGELGKKVAFGETGLHTMTLAGGHLLNYTFNGEKQPKLSELWAYGIGQAIAEHAASTPKHIFSSDIQDYLMKSNATLTYAAFETCWYLIFGKFLFLKK